MLAKPGEFLISISSFYQTLTSFSRHDLLKTCQHAIADALPVVPLITSLSGLFLLSHPQIFRNDDLNDEGEDFVVTDFSKERLGQVIDLYLKKQVEVIAPSEELKSSTLANLKSTFVDNCCQRIMQIGKIAADFGIKKVGYGISLHNDRTPCSPYAAIGIQSSYFSDPIIIHTPPHFKIQVDPSIQYSEGNVKKDQQPSEKSKDFIIAHEMVHIAKNHSLISSISHVGFSVLTTCAWALKLQAGLSLSSVSWTYGAVLGTAVLFRLFYPVDVRKLGPSGPR